MSCFISKNGTNSWRSLPSGRDVIYGGPFNVGNMARFIPHTMICTTEQNKHHIWWIFFSFLKRRRKLKFFRGKKLVKRQKGGQSREDQILIFFSSFRKGSNWAYQNWTKSSWKAGNSKKKLKIFYLHSLSVFPFSQIRIKFVLKNGFTHSCSYIISSSPFLASSDDLKFGFRCWK